MYCSFNSKYDSYTKRIILSLFFFEDNVKSVQNIVFEREILNNNLHDLHAIHKKFLIHSINKLKSRYNKLTFIMPKLNERNAFYGMRHINYKFISEVIRGNELDAHSKKIIIKEYNQVEYLHKEFMPSLFISINNFNKSLLKNKYINEKALIYNYEHIKDFYIDFTQEKKDSSFFDKYITIFTDAAFDSDNNAYGWGAWIKHKNKTYRFSDWGFTKDNNHGEMHAINFALLKLIELHKEGEINLSKKVVSLTTDSDKCISLIHRLNKNERFTQRLSELKGSILQHESEYDFELRLKGIKSHIGNKTDKHAVNNWCDKEAKKQLSKVRSLISKGKVKYVKDPKETYANEAKKNLKKKNKNKRKFYKSKIK